MDSKWRKWMEMEWKWRKWIEMEWKWRQWMEMVEMDGNGNEVYQIFLSCLPLGCSSSFLQEPAAPFAHRASHYAERWK